MPPSSCLRVLIYSEAVRQQLGCLQPYSLGPKHISYEILGCPGLGGEKKI